MARNLLSPTTVANCKLADGKLEELLSDGDKLYLRLRRVGYTVTKSWQFIYLHPITKARQKITRGGPPDTSLAEAREWAEKQRGILNRGDDPKAVAEQEALQKAADLSLTLGALLAAYVSHLERAGKVSAREAEKAFRVHVPQTLLQIPARDVKPEHIAAIVRKVVQADKGRTAGKLRAYLNAAFAMALASVHDAGLSGDMAAFGLSTNPVPRMPSLGAFNRVRDRHLSGAELIALVQRLEGEPQSDARDLLLLAIYTGGQRLTQLLKATLVENGTVIRILDKKGKRQHPRIHLVPLIGKALALVHQGRGGKLFGLTEDKQIDAALDANKMLIKRICTSMQADGISEKRFTPDAIRKTAETLLVAGLGISKDLRAQLQSHGLSGIQDRHYDKHNYMNEKRQVLESWWLYLDQLASDQTNIITLGDRRTRA